MPRRQFSSASSRVHTRVPRRRRAWELGPGGDDIDTWDPVTVSTSAPFIMGSGITSGALADLTIKAIYGFIEVRLTAAAGVGDGFNFAFGIGIANSEAFAQGVASLLDPFDDIGSSTWQWHHMMNIHTAIGALAIGDPSENPVRIPIKVVTARKLQLNEVMYLCGQSGENPTAIASVLGVTRALVLLP